MINDSKKLAGPFLIDLKNRFREIAGSDQLIDITEFQSGLKISNDQVSRRLFEIFDKDRFYRKFLVSKKNQKNLNKIYFGLIYNLSKFDAKLFFISLNNDKPEMNDNLDNLIYSFNNKSITINNWISLRSFVNKILSSYPG